ncbi:prepilin peptidase [Acetobacterium bakii]|uniref:prepilin peptidase n=1 Tax=Acetobacterium bakii TaxID=52689 RepID=UPI0006826496|nr:prepilin peptidase [Acetobacterium bakii]
MTTDYAVIMVLGFVTGLIMEKASGILISNRVNTFAIPEFLGRIRKSLMWATLNAFSWLFVIGIIGLNPQSMETILIISVCIVLSMVDMSIRKIPNELILLTIIIGTSFVITGHELGNIGMNLMGFAVGFILFLLPAYIGRGAGWGDVKYAAAVGFCLGVYGFLTAIIIMSFILLICTAYIILTGKGNLKSKIALGPFMAFGFVSVLIINIINGQYLLFDLGRLINGSI